VKAIVKGQHSGGVFLTIPLVCSLAAKKEEMPLGEFLYNATKMANSLSAIFASLGGDGVVVEGGASFLESEVIGCEVDRDRWPPTLTASSVERLRQLVNSQSVHFQNTERISVISDVINRLKLSLTDKSAIVVVLTGPWNLSTTWLNYLNPQEPGCVSESLLELASSVIRKLTQEFCSAGADIVILREDSLPEILSSGYESWEYSVLPVCNIIRHYEALPVALFKGAVGTLEKEQIRALAESIAGFIPVFGIASMDSLSKLPSGKVGGIAVPPQLLTNGDMLEEIQTRLSNLSQKIVLITTEGEIPYDMDISLLPQMVSSLKIISQYLY